MKYVTKHTVKSGGEYFPPGSDFEPKDKQEAKRLLDAGAIEEKKIAASEAKSAAETGGSAGTAGEGASEPEKGKKGKK